MSDVNNPKSQVSGADIERPTFDIVFQMGILKLAIQEDFFCTQLVKYLADDEDLDDYTIFDTDGLQKVFKLIVDSLKEFGSRPTEGQIRQKFNEEPDDDTRSDLNALLDQILNTDTHNESYYRNFLTTYIQQVKMAKGFIKTKKIWKKHPDNAPEFMQKVIDDIRRVAFEKEDIVTMNDLPNLISEGVALNTRKIPTGVKELDIDLVGGLPRENLTVVLAGTNVGKSLFCISLACNALLAVDENGQNKGFKVLHVNLEGMRDEAVKRYAANLSKINYGDLIRGSYDEQAKQRIEEVSVKFGPDRFKVRNMLGFGATIEELVAFCREEHKSFKFDMVIIDYGQLLETKQKTEGHRFAMARVFRGLDSISKEFGAVVITPAQATRGAQENQQTEFRPRRGGMDAQPEKAPILRSTDISEAFEIARVAGVILTLNRTEDEERQNRLRLYLEKQRQGAKNKLYGLITNYSQANLITGKTYNPNEVVIEGEMEIQKPQKGLTGTMTSLQNLPKPKPKVDGDLSATEVKEEKLSDMVIFLENLHTEFSNLREEYYNIKTEYDAARESDEPYDNDEMDKKIETLGKIQGRMKSIELEARGILTQAYPHANKEILEESKKTLNDVKKSNPKEAEKIERLIRHIELGLGLSKKPF